jgi:DNA-binding NarL/FixJ family response regulator
VCCNLIAACEDAGDFDRAVQWCDEVKAFARRWELRTLFNVCRTQYASILVNRGTWSEAEAELEAALQDFGDSRRLAPGIAQLGELRRRQGRLDEARALFARVEHHPVARMGVAELSLDAGDAAGAISLAERVLRGISREERLRYVPALGIVVRAAAVAGRIERAREAAAQLRALAAEIGAPQFAAAAALAEGIVAAADENDAAARALFEDAVELYGRSQLPYERARARLLLARALGRQGLTGRALEEARVAEEAFRELDAARDARTASDVRRSLDGSAGRAAGLTRREVDVLRLLARGLSNRDIAEALVLSEHTIHRHVANILRKLGEPSRAAAAARATRDGVI